MGKTGFWSTSFLHDQQAEAVESLLESKKGESCCQSLQWRQLSPTAVTLGLKAWTDFCP